jgi:DICT domain-containing protein
VVRCSNRTGYKPLLIELSRQLERRAEVAGTGCLVVAAFQHARYFTPLTAARYEQLAGRVAFVAALGEAMPSRPLPGVRGATLDHDDPIRDEWDIAIIGPRAVAALAARDLGDTGPDAQRRFAFAVTYDVNLVARMVSSIMCRVVPRE